MEKLLNVAFLVYPTVVVGLIICKLEGLLTWGWPQVLSPVWMVGVFIAAVYLELVFSKVIHAVLGDK